MGSWPILHIFPVSCHFERVVSLWFWSHDDWHGTQLSSYILISVCYLSFGCVFKRLGPWFHFENKYLKLSTHTSYMKQSFTKKPIWKTWSWKWYMGHLTVTNQNIKSLNIKQKHSHNPAHPYNRYWHGTSLTKEIVQCGHLRAFRKLFGHSVKKDSCCCWCPLGLAGSRLNKPSKYE